MNKQIIISGVLGASIGSFLNVIAHRSVQGRSWWGKERSNCEFCGHILGASELIPIFSWLFQRGRCKNCGAKISVRYLLVELITALAAMIVTARWGISWASFLSYIGTGGLILNSLTDIESGEIFDIFAITFGALGLFVRLAGGSGAIIDGVAGALIGWLIFALIISLSHGGMGWGDASFMAGMGAVLGWKLTILAFYAGIMAGGICVLFMLLIGLVHWGKGESVPLVPFLAIGCFTAMILGPEILAVLGKRFASPGIFAATWPF